MRFVIKHEIKGRMRLHIQQKRMTCQEADILQYYLSNQKCITSAKVYERTGDVAVSYIGNREDVIELFMNFKYEKAVTVISDGSRFLLLQRVEVFVFLS